MPVTDSDFRPYFQNGIQIKRDIRARERILEVGSRSLADKRSGTEIDDHLSADSYCQRKAVLNKLAQLQILGESEISGQPPVFESTLQGKQLIYFGLGHGFQDTILPGSEVATWSDEWELWYSPDGKHALGLEDYHEVKTTRRSQLKKQDQIDGKSVEHVIFEMNPQWFEYMLGVMFLERINKMHLSVAWIIPAEFETFTVEATDEAIQNNWRYLTKRRLARRESVASFFEKDSNVRRVQYHGKFYDIPNLFPGDEGTDLPDVTTRAFPGECQGCPWLSKQPCMSDVPLADSREFGE